MKLIPVKTRLLKQFEDAVESLLRAIQDQGLKLRNGDVLAITDKIIALSEGRIVKMRDFKPSCRAKKLAERYNLEPPFVEMVLREADEVYGGVTRAILTLKDNILIANAGMDHKNVPQKSISLWPSNPHKSANKIRKEILMKTGKKIGVVLVDSHVSPLRMGTTGFALGISGFNPVKDYRGRLDLYGKPLMITRLNLADDMAAAAHLLMGESDERVPLVIIRGAPVELTEDYNPRTISISKEDCIYMKNLLNHDKVRED